MPSYHHHISQLKNYISLSSGTNAAADLPLSAAEDKALAEAAGQPRAQTSPCTRHISLSSPRMQIKTNRSHFPPRPMQLARLWKWTPFLPDISFPLERGNSLTLHHERGSDMLHVEQRKWMALSETLVSSALHLIFRVRILQRISVLNLQQFSSAKWISWSRWKALPYNFLSLKVILR